MINDDSSMNLYGSKSSVLIVDDPSTIIGTCIDHRKSSMMIVFQKLSTDDHRRSTIIGDDNALEIMIVDIIFRKRFYKRRVLDDHQCIMIIEFLHKSSMIIDGQIIEDTIIEDHRGFCYR